jgi:hypothetical protein
VSAAPTQGVADEEHDEESFARSERGWLVPALFILLIATAISVAGLLLRETSIVADDAPRDRFVRVYASQPRSTTLVLQLRVLCIELLCAAVSADSLKLPELEPLWLALPDALRDPEPLPPPLAVPVGEPLPEDDGEALAERDAEPLALALGDAVPEPELLPVRVGVPLPEPLLDQDREERRHHPVGEGVHPHTQRDADRHPRGGDERPPPVAPQVAPPHSDEEHDRRLLLEGLEGEQRVRVGHVELEPLEDELRVLARLVERHQRHRRGDRATGDHGERRVLHAAHERALLVPELDLRRRLVRLDPSDDLAPHHRRVFARCKRSCVVVIISIIDRVRVDCGRGVVTGGVSGAEVRVGLCFGSREAWFRVPVAAP